MTVYQSSDLSHFVGKQTVPWKSFSKLAVCWHRFTACLPTSAVLGHVLPSSFQFQHCPHPAHTVRGLRIACRWLDITFCCTDNLWTTARVWYIILCVSVCLTHGMHTNTCTCTWSHKCTNTEKNRKCTEMTKESYPVMMLAGYQDWVEGCIFSYTNTVYRTACGNANGYSIGR